MTETILPAKPKVVALFPFPEIFLEKNGEMNIKGATGSLCLNQGPGKPISHCCLGNAALGGCPFED